MGLIFLWILFQNILFIACASCIVGYYEQSGCKECQKGYYCPGDDGKYECQPGEYADAKGMGTCTLCGYGEYQSGIKSHSCDSCGAGTTTLAQGSTSSGDCTTCPVGQIINGNNQCEGCAAGSFFDAGGTSTCQLCPAGTYTSSAGLSACSTCNAGSFSLLGTSSCTPCSGGTFQDLSGQGLCKVCSAGFYSSGGATSCTPCNPNTYNPSSAQSSCLNCPPNSESLSQATSCTCVSNSYQSSSSPLTCIVCHSFCLACNTSPTYCTSCISSPGIVKNSFSCDCDISQGYYQIMNPVSGKDECNSCNKLCTLCFGGNSNECTQCVSVAELDGTTCHCPEGTYFSTTATAVADYCVSCPNFCTSCDSSGKCTACVSSVGVVLQNDLCICQTNLGYIEYFNTGSGIMECISCHPLCQSCSGPTSSECLQCDSNKGAIFESPSTCKCSSSKYYKELIETCVACHVYCGDCDGPTQNNCLTCNEAVAYSVEGQANMCVHDCNDLGAFYTDGNVCRPCDSSCASCYGGSASQCITCSTLNAVQYLGSCVAQCGSHYFASLGICYSCHPSCGDCLDSTYSHCINCAPGLLFYGGQCLQNCMNGSYDNNLGSCQTCPIECSACLSATQCTSCASGYFLVMSTKSCVSAAYCPIGTYADQAEGKCNSCAVNCYTCSGPLLSDCTICNYIKGYSRTNNVGTCYLLKCLPTTYMHISSVSQKATCLPCPTGCEECKEANNIVKCLTCQQSYKAVYVGSENYITCLSCQQVNPGFEKGEDGNCREICGDGLHLGELECDDGNKIDGDGCSADCKVEEGYSCNHTGTAADICVDSSPPISNLKVLSDSILTVLFSEKMYSTVSGNNFSARVHISVDPLPKECIFNYSVDNSIQANSPFSSFNASTSYTCSILESSTIVTVEFSSDPFLFDLAGNALDTSMMKAKCSHHNHLSETEITLIEATGNTCAYLSIILLIIAILMLLCRSVTVTAFWAFINMLQILIMLPAINVYLPYNLEVFISTYLIVDEINLPFKLLPDDLPNPMSFLDSFKTGLSLERLTLCGIEDVNAVANLAENISTWAFMLASYFIIQFLVHCLPSKAMKILDEWRQDFEYNAVIRMIIESYLQLCFCSLLNISVLPPNGIHNSIAYWGSCFVLLFCIVFFIINIRLVAVESEELLSETYLAKYGTIIEGLSRSGEYVNLSYNTFFLLRRIFYALTLVLLSNYPVIQLVICLFVLTIPIILYLFFTQPFENAQCNFINLFNEFIIAVSFSILLFINSFEMVEKRAKILGWIIIALVCFSLLCTWVILFPPAVRECIERIKNCCCSSNEEKIAPRQLDYIDSKDPIAELSIEASKNESHHSVLTCQIQDVPRRPANSLTSRLPRGKRKSTFFVEKNKEYLVQCFLFGVLGFWGFGVLGFWGPQNPKTPKPQNPKTPNNLKR